MRHRALARTRSWSRRTALGGLGLLAAAVVLTGCAGSPEASGTAGEPSEPAAAASSPAEPDTPPQAATQAPTAEEFALSEALDHVHGLHVSADGVLLAGTHTGVVEVDPGGAVTRVGSDRHDLMGMTGIPGTDTLVSSGHPGAGSGLPNPLGLIISADGGTTWSTRALTGEVDFHALASDGETVAGFAGPQGLLISSDGGATFELGAAIAPAALAITPLGIWATTAEGLQRSTDGGRAFTAVEDAPLLVLIASGADGSLWGIGTNGTAWRSTDGTAWEERAPVGPVEALAVGASGTAYALTAEALIALS